MQQQVEIAARMYKARDAMIFLLGEAKFKEWVEGFRPILRAYCDKHDLSELEAMIKFLEIFKDSAEKQLLALAACTEIMEPS